MKRYLVSLGIALVLLPVLVAAAVLAPAPAAVSVAGGAAGDAAQVQAAPVEMRGYFLAAARRFVIPPALLVAIATVESGFNPTAVGPPTPYGHAFGMMQFLESSWRIFNVVPGATPFDPGPAVLAAANHLATSGRLARGGWDAAQAVFGYNHSADYVATVLGWAAQYGYRYDPKGPPRVRVRYRFPVRGATSVMATGAGFATLTAATGSSVVACVRAVVLSISESGGAQGATVTLRGEDGWLYHYRHIAGVPSSMTIGAVLGAGTTLGRVGSSGARRVRLQFGISRGDDLDRWVDPTPYLSTWRQRG